MKLTRVMFQLFLVAIMPVCLCLAGYHPAFAEGECRGDIAKFCQGAQGPKQQMECLKMNHEWLSPQCKMHIVQVLGAVKEAHQDCEPEIYAFCPGVPPGGGHVLRCLKAHQFQLSPACKAGIADLIMSK